MDTTPLPSAASASIATRVPRFIVLHALPLVVIAATVACEHLVRTGKSATWLAGSEAMETFHFCLQVVRIIAASMALGTWTWFAGAVRIEDSPSAAEALHAGWTASFRIALTVLPMLLLSVLFMLIVAAAIRFGIIMFVPVGAWAAVLCLTFILACVVPPLLFVAAKYALLVPVSVFEKAPPLQAIAFAGARMTLRTMLCLWFMLGIHAIIVLACVLLPVWCFVGGIWHTLGTVYNQPGWILARQIAGLAFFVVGAPVACASMATLYFIVQPPAPEPRTDQTND